MKAKAKKKCKRIANYKHTIAFDRTYYRGQLNVEEERKWNTYAASSDN